MGYQERAAIYAALGDETRLEIIDALVLSDLTAGELAARLTMPTNLLAHHLGVLEAVHLVRRRRSDADGRRRYLSLEPDVLPEPILPRPLRGNSVLFVCRHNSARSQMAAAMFGRHSEKQARSAGSQPAERVHPKARAAAAERGLELAESPLGYGDVGRADVVVSVCDIAGEEPPPFHGIGLHWSVPDPVSSGRIEAFRRTLADLDHRVATLARALS